MLFLDIKGGFDNVNPSTLCSILKAKAVIPYLVSWTRSFLTGTCRLRYQRSPKVFAPVSVGTPQGSPSPLSYSSFTFPACIARFPRVSPSPTSTTLA